MIATQRILYTIVRTYNLLLAIIPAIAFYRATVQPDYKWGLLVIHGKGTSTEYWFLLLFLIYSWSTFVLEACYKRKWYYFMPILLFGMVSFTLLYGYLTQTDMVFQGDAWKFKFDMGLAFVLASLFLLIVVIVWTYKDLQYFEESKYSISRPNRLNLFFGLSMSIVIFALFAQGRGGIHTIFDRIAVGLTIFQAMFISNIIDKVQKNNRE